MRPVHENNAGIYHSVVQGLVQDVIKYLLREFRGKTLAEGIVEIQEFYVEKPDFLQIWQLDSRFHSLSIKLASVPS